ncbi:MAG: NAD-dependent epimerase/dehydratase family protein, partial [Bowdeniella nasicola]|nr:NAD-dependent epimerase/dehydratase family protein [Bowdeniella nasicola]
MTLLITGSHGFLGRHLRLLLASRGVDALLADRHNWNELEALVAQADRIIHLAGVNRGSDTEVREGNLALADDVIRACGTQRARTIVYANTIHAGRDDAYGIGKQGAAKLFASWRDASEGIFVDIHLPNLFGEEGRPFYNSVVATFVEQLATGSPAQVGRAQIPLLHVQQAAHALLHACLHPEETREPHGIEISVA